MGKWLLDLCIGRKGIHKSARGIGISSGEIPIPLTDLCISLKEIPISPEEICKFFSPTTQG